MTNESNVLYCSTNTSNSFTYLGSGLNKADTEKKENSDSSHRNGKWTIEEHSNFIFGSIKFGNDWKEIQKLIKTRSCAQARSHSQKFFRKLKKIKLEGETNYSLTSVKDLQNLSKTLTNEKLKTLMKTLTAIHNSLDGSEINIENMEKFQELSSSKQSWTTSVCTRIDPSSDFPNCSEIQSFMKFCDGALWKVDQEFILIKKNSCPIQSEISETSELCLQRKTRRLKRMNLRINKMKNSCSPRKVDDSKNIIDSLNSFSFGPNDTKFTDHISFFSNATYDEGTYVNTANYNINYTSNSDNIIFNSNKEGFHCPHTEANPVFVKDKVFENSNELQKEVFNYENEIVFNYLSRT